MANVYSERLYLGHGITTESFAPPAGNVWVVKLITVFLSGGAGAGQVQLIDGDTSATIWYQGVTLVASSEFYFWPQLHLVIPSEQETFWNNTWGGSINADVGLFGYALTLP